MDPTLSAADLTHMGLRYKRLGDYERALDLHGQALAIARDLGDRHSESVALGNLGNCCRHLGRYGQALDLHGQALAIARDLGDRQGEAAELGNLGNCYCHFGDYEQALDLHSQALAIARDLGDRHSEGVALANLGRCLYLLGDYEWALDLHARALAIARDLGDRYSENFILDNLGRCRYVLGDYGQAFAFNRQALAIARDLGDRYGEANALTSIGLFWLASDDARQAFTVLERAVHVATLTGDIETAMRARLRLAQTQLQLNDPTAALATTAVHRDLPYPPAAPTLWLLEGMAQLELGRPDEGVRAFRAAVTAANALLGLANNNIAALEVRALALSALAVATGDPSEATKAEEAFARTHTITRATGVAAETRRLFHKIESHDQTGILANVRGGHD
jgi:tetratricopeptide (TPR) repeat protein